MPKRYLLVDNDNTLMDFNLAERRALTETLRLWGLPEDEAVVAHRDDSRRPQRKVAPRGRPALRRGRDA